MRKKTKKTIITKIPTPTPKIITITVRTSSVEFCMISSPQSTISTQISTGSSRTSSQPLLTVAQNVGLSEHNQYSSLPHFE